MPPAVGSIGCRFDLTVSDKGQSMSLDPRVLGPRRAVSPHEGVCPRCGIFDALRSYRFFSGAGRGVVVARPRFCCRLWEVGGGRSFDRPWSGHLFGHGRSKGRAMQPPISFYATLRLRGLLRRGGCGGLGVKALSSSFHVEPVNPLALRGCRLPPAQ